MDELEIEMTLEEEYVNAFHKHYPTKDVVVKYRRKFDGFAVYIDGDAGDKLLSEADMRAAIRMFNN
jgi:hypothetical protein